MSGKFRAIWRLSEGNRMLYSCAVAALVIASCFLYLAPVIPQLVLDNVLTGGDGYDRASSFHKWLIDVLGGREFIAANLWLPGLIIVLLTVAAGVFTYLRGRWSAMATERITRRVRDRVYDHLQHLPASYFDSAETGDLVQRCTSDVETLRVFLSTQVVEMGRALIMLIVPLPLMLLIDVRMTIASVVMLPAVLVFGVYFFGCIRRQFKKVDEAEGAMTTCVQENLTGVRVVRAFARQDFECEKFHQRNLQHRKLDNRLYELFAWYWAISDLLVIMQKSLVVGCGAYWLAKGELQVGAFFFFLSAVMMFLFPIRMMGRILADLGKALVAMDRLREILDEPREGDQDDATVVSKGAATLEGGIEFAGVSFSHGGTSPVLRDVSFKVKPGETLALLGPSGCGKSTIINLLLRLYDFESGDILLDGNTLRSLPRKAVRAQMAVVLQEPFLYSKSIRENVKLGRSSASDEEMLVATSVAAVHESISRFEDAYETKVGERGVTLSGGQRQRVALARALLQHPAILVLDDALSAVDTETESMILNALKERRGRHTTVLIAHRLSTLMHADQILVMDHGSIIQRGTHESLLREHGLYRRLWGIQTSLESEIEQSLAAEESGTRS